MLALIAAGDDDEAGHPSVLASIRSDAGNVSLNMMLTEIAKLEAVRAVGLPGDVFADVTPKIVTAWRGRAAVESPSHLRDHPTDVTLTLLSALLYCREREITDTLVDLLCSTVHRIGARRGPGDQSADQGVQTRHGQGESAVPARGGDRGRR